MQIKDIKDLEKVIKLCRKTGVDVLKIDNVEFHLGQEPVKKLSQKRGEFVTESALQAPQNTYTPGGITEDVKIPGIELTEEQLLFYSSSSTNEQQ